MLRIILLATSLLIAGAAGAEEVYEGKLLKREGLYYKPRSLEPFSGKNRSMYGSGRPSSEINYKDGKRIGLARTFHLFGELAGEMNYKDGMLHGSYVHWDEDGQLMTMLNHKDGERHGIFREWNEEGELTRLECYFKGKEVDMSQCETDSN